MEHPSVETLARALAGLDADACVKLVEEVGRAVGPDRLLHEIFLPALSKVGDIWARGLLDDLAFAQAAVITEQLWTLAGAGTAAAARGPTAAGPVVVVGVPSPDQHDVGKNQVVRLLDRAGARVHDLGREVGPEAFGEKAIEVGAAAVVLSASTQASLARVGEVREGLDEAGSDAKLVVGGQAALSAEGVEEADIVVSDAYETVDEVMSLDGGGS